MKFLADLLMASASLNDSKLFNFSELIGKYRDNFGEISSRLYERLSSADQKRFIAWFMKRWGGINTVDKIEWERYVAVVEQSHVVHGHEELGGVSYCLRRYESAGYSFSLLGYDWFTGVHDVVFDQYATEVFDVRPGDVVIDGGAFIGDTAVLFDAKTSGDCEIHAFELLDENITLMRRNLEMNGLSGKVVVNKTALGDKSGVDISIAATRLQASTSLMFPGAIVVPMIKLDDYVKEHQLSRVDFIKFDIEGAEIPALEGARETIERFHPRLALCLYHKWDDVLIIPRFLDSLTVKYDFEFKWVHLKLGTEGVILLTPKAPADICEVAPVVEMDELQPMLFNLLDAYHRKYSQAYALWEEKKLSDGQAHRDS